MGRQWIARLGAIAGLVLTVSAEAFAQTSTESGKDRQGLVERISDERRIGLYTIRVHDFLIDANDRVPMDQELRILRGDRVLATVDDQHVAIEFLQELVFRPDYRAPAVGANVIGGSEPNLLVYRYSGGAHCCHTVDVFELGQDVRKLGEIHGEDVPVLFQDTDGDAALEVEVHDNTFTYWRTSFSDSPLIPVLLKFDPASRRYRFASELMRKRGPLPDALPGLAQKLLADVGWSDWTNRPRVTPALWKAMLDYVYSGQASAARRLLDMVWRPDRDGKEAFFDELMKCQLRHSPFWEDIAALNGLPPDKPEGDCPGPQ